MKLLIAVPSFGRPYEIDKKIGFKKDYPLIEELKNPKNDSFDIDISKYL